LMPQRPRYASRVYVRVMRNRTSKAMRQNREATDVGVAYAVQINARGVRNIGTAREFMRRTLQQPQRRRSASAI